MTVNEELILAPLFSAEGGSYDTADPAAVAGGEYVYRLVEIELDGTERRVGPYTVVVDGGPLTLDEWSQRVFSDEELGTPSVSAPNADPDGDGASNDAERVAGTDPLDAESVLAIAEVRRLPDGTMLLTWPSSANRAYRVWRTPSLSQAFEPISDVLTTTPPLNAFAHVPSGGGGFYKVEVMDRRE